jgi:hypothetical protein
MQRRLRGLLAERLDQLFVDVPPHRDGDKDSR